MAPLVRDGLWVPAPSALQLVDRGDDLADQAVLLGGLGGHPEIALGILLDLLQRLAGLLGDDAVQTGTHLENLFGLDLEIGGAAAGAAGRLMEQEAGVG